MLVSIFDAPTAGASEYCSSLRCVPTSVVGNDGHDDILIWSGEVRGGGGGSAACFGDTGCLASEAAADRAGGTGRVSIVGKEEAASGFRAIAAAESAAAAAKRPRQSTIAGTRYRDARVGPEKQRGVEGGVGPDF